MDPTNLGELDETDPESLARIMKKVGEEMGEDTSDIEETMMADSATDRETIDHTDSL
jgi:hypothetical protein